MSRRDGTRIAGARAVLRTCATLWLAASVAGCGLAHERDPVVHPTPAPDAAPTVLDAAVPPIDAFVSPDAVVAPDAGSCTEHWASLPSCPASTEGAVGHRCPVEGVTCGVACCEPGPAIVCSDGLWSRTTGMVCGIDCAPTTPCGDGECAPGRVCVVTDGERGGLGGYCVVPPAPILSCEDVPPGALSSDPRSCLECLCAPGPAGPVIALTCACCDR